MKLKEDAKEAPKGAPKTFDITFRDSFRKAFVYYLDFGPLSPKKDILNLSYPLKSLISQYGFKGAL